MSLTGSDHVNRMLTTVALCLCCLAASRVRAEAAKEEAPAKPDVTKADIQKALAGCAHCTFNSTKVCMPAIKLGDVVYAVKVDEKASEATKKLVASLADMKEPAKHVVFKGKPMDEKAAAALGTEIKSYYEIGEMSVE